MKKISFFTPVVYGNHSKNLKDSLGEIADDYFYLGGRRAHVIHVQKNYQIEIRSDQVKTAYKILKLISYGTLLVPLIFLIIKLAHRTSRRFHILRCEDPPIQKKAHEEPIRQEEEVTILKQGVNYGTTLDPSKLSIPTGEIKEGHGEYVVFQEEEGKNSAISKETYEKVYELMNRFSPLSIAISPPECPINDYYEFISKKIKEIDKKLKIAFIPRTLYELYFVRKSIKEEVKANANCKALNPKVQELLARDPLLWDEKAKECHEKQLAGKCWHQRYVQSPEDYNQPGVKEVAYRLNQYIVRKVLENRDGLSYTQLQIQLEKELTFLSSHFEKIESAAREEETQMKFINCDTPGAATSFGTESTRGSIKPLAFSYECYKKMVRDVVALECSELAKKSFLFFRGASLSNDNCFANKKMRPKCSVSAFEALTDGKEVPYSLSFGTSLFAGHVFDGGACAFSFMRDSRNNAYIITVPKDHLRDSPFYLPAGNAVSQLFGKGEIFHARTKTWKGYKGNVPGIQSCGGNEDTHHLRSSLVKKEFIQQFIEYKKQALILKKF